MNEKEMGASEIYLAPQTEVFDQAAEIAQTTVADTKYPFVLEYDLNEKEYLLSVLNAVGAVVTEENDSANSMTISMNMSQLRLIENLDCITRVKTDEGKSMRRAAFDAPQINNEAVATASVEAQVMTLANDEVMIANEVNVASADEGIAVACVSGCTTGNNTKETALEISVETVVNGCICCPGAEQWFKFTVPESKTYTIYTTGSLETEGTLHDYDGNRIDDIDDHPLSGKLNLRIVKYLTANVTYYICVTESKLNIGNFYLKVTQHRLVDYISLNKSQLTLDHIGKVYELPIIPNTFTGVEDAAPLTTLVASTVPSDANEKKVFWYCPDCDVIRIDSGWHNGQRYQTLTIVANGTAKLYAYDWNENGTRGECTINAGGGWPVQEKPVIKSRNDWGARNVETDRLVSRERKPKMIIFHHTADKFSSTNIADIKDEIQKIQNKQMDDIFPNNRKCDIAYHFIIDPAGGIWQGAEIDDYKRGHAEGHFDDIGVVLLGDFESRLLNGNKPNTLNSKQKEAMKILSKWLCYEYNLEINKTANISPITTHKMASGNTECPGDNVEPWVENDLKNYINNWHP